MPIFHAPAESPEAFADQWRPYERVLRERYAAMGAPSMELTRMLDRLRPIYLRHAFIADQHHSTDEGDPFDRVQSWILQMSVGLLFEIAEREGKLIRLGAA